MPTTRDELGGAGRPSHACQPSTFRIHNVSTLSLFNVKWMRARRCLVLVAVDVLLFSLLIHVQHKSREKKARLSISPSLAWLALRAGAHESLGTRL